MAPGLSRKRKLKQVADIDPTRWKRHVIWCIKICSTMILMVWSLNMLNPIELRDFKNHSDRNWWQSSCRSFRPAQPSGGWRIHWPTTTGGDAPAKDKTTWNKNAYFNQKNYLIPCFSRLLQCPCWIAVRGLCLTLVVCWWFGWLDGQRWCLKGPFPSDFVWITEASFC